MPRRITVAAALLLLSGSVAVAGGVCSQQAPPRPSVAAEAASPEQTVSPTHGDATVAASPTPQPARTEVARPVEIRIPAIGVRSPVVALGLNPDGSLQVPQPGRDYDKAAWFDGSPRPGQLGPAVIEGHVDGATGPSVFFRLGAVSPGDAVTVVRADGSHVRFAVRALRTYPKSQFPGLEVYGNTAAPELRLITCGGHFDPGSGHYVDNVVVFARRA